MAISQAFADQLISVSHRISFGTEQAQLDFVAVVQAEVETTETVTETAVSDDPAPTE